MKLLFVGFSLRQAGGGIERYTFRLLSHLRERGHRVHVYTYSQDWPGPRIARYPTIDRFFLLPRLFVHAKARRVDGILCGHIHLSGLCVKVSRLLGVPWALAIYGIDAWAGRLLSLANARPLPLLVSISAFTTMQAIKQGWPAECVQNVPPVVEPVRPVCRMVRTSERTCTLLTVGRLSHKEKYKGHDVVISALKIVADSIAGIRYRIVGTGDDESRLRALAREEGVANIVDFAGFVSDDELAFAYADCDVFVMPSRVSLDPAKPEGEGFGIVFLEAALQEKPLIGPKEGGPTDIINDGVNGYLVDPRNPQELADRIIRLARDPALCATMGRAARQTVLAKFTTAQLDEYLAPVLEHLGQTRRKA